MGGKTAPSWASSGAPTPPGYSVIQHDAARAIATDEAAGWVRSVLATGRTLHAWAGSQLGARSHGGRGTVYAVDAPAPGPDGRHRWAARHYRRGGALAGILDDRYLRVGRPRPFRELALSVEARSRGVSTPAVVAGAAYADGIFYRCDLLTELVAGARPLADLLADPAGGASDGTLLAATVDAIRSLSDAGVYHVDLNAHNVLLQDGVGRAWVVDLDRARLLDRPARGAGARMRDRLVRSLCKEARCAPEGDGDRQSRLAAALESMPL